MVTWSKGRFIPDFGQTLTPALDTRAPTFWADLLAEFKPHARIDWADEDATCNLYLSAAVSRIEQYTLLPIAPVAYDWNVDVAHRCTDYEIIPLQNCALPGEQFGFELLIAPKRIAAPVAWPVFLEVGFASGAAAPHDLKAAIFALALGLYEFRSSPEMQDVHAQAVMSMSLARYWVPRV
jgi:hypothetical protein